MRVLVNGVHLFFDVVGAKLIPDGAVMRERPTLVLIHGGPGTDHSLLKPGMSVLADTAQVVYYDQRGHGRSDLSDPEHWNLDQWAADLVAVCEALEVVKPVVMGGSFGGYVAMAYATTYPDHPSKLILASTRAKAPDFSRALAVFERLGGGEARSIAAQYFEDPSEANLRDFIRVTVPLYTRTPQDSNVPRRAIHTRQVTEHFRRHELLNMNLLARLLSVKCPTLLLGGEDDPMVPIEDQEDIAAALPQHLVQFHRVPNAGHGPYRDDPHVFDIIREFILS
jgi:proline iminopeptidase